ncbi:MAG TPA: V-type ATPase subunit [Thermoplasmata archaeon]|nr:V-type ATPase subunit [Thermoplasmata archaeon]
MAGSPYASALGRLKPDLATFLPKETYATLLAAKDLNDLAKLLESTLYADDITRERATRQGGPLVEAAVNRMLVRRNRRAFESTPFAGRQVVGAYLGRWDVQNVEFILSSKAQGRPITETEVELVSSRDIPAGLYAGVMTLDDIRSVVQQPTVEAVVSALVKFGYGTTILPFLESYQRTHDIFPIFHALDAQYYRDVGTAAKFFQGDEWVVRQFLASEVDARNVLLLLKARKHGLPIDEVQNRWLDGGTLGAAQLSDLFSARTVPEMVERLSARSPSLPEGNEEYGLSESLTGYEVALQRDRAVTELKRLRTYPLSLGVIFTYLLLAELERADLRRIAFGRLYNLPNERIEPLLVSRRL